MPKGTTGYVFTIFVVAAFAVFVLVGALIGIGAAIGH
jgi:hypothetical protein